MSDWIAKQSAEKDDEEASFVSLRMAQRTSVQLHQKNARAIFQRSVAGHFETNSPSPWDGVNMQELPG